jgi:uncharacterized membrane protein
MASARSLSGRRLAVARPRISARAHNHLRRRRAVRGMVIGALLITGLFTLPFGCVLGSWLLG